MNAGPQNFTWDGRDNNGVKWPDGNYTMSVTAKDASGQSVSIPSEIQGVVDSVDLTKTPAGALDRRPDLHARQDQARGAAGGMIRLRVPVARACFGRLAPISPPSFRGAP